jgi:hypothetical protein
MTIITILLLFATLVTYEYIRDLRRDLKSARELGEEGWRQYEHAIEELRKAKGLPAHKERLLPEPEEKKDGFQPGLVGRTAILTRDFGQIRETRDDDGMRRPARPTSAEIAEAAREAVNGDGLG